MLFSTLTKITTVVSILSQVAFAADSTEAEALAAHNKYRAKHHVPPVTWSPKLVENALTITKICKFQTVKMKNVGENLGLGYSSITAAIDSWYKTGAKYDYALADKEDFQNGTLSFSQVVWKKTTEIGCVVATNCSNLGGDFQVCTYEPQGNIRGHYAANVIKP